MHQEGRTRRVRFEIASEIPIVETHQHLSEPDVKDRTFGWGGNHIDAILAAMDEHGVASAILQPLGGAQDPVGVHRQIAAHARKHPGRIYGIASMNVKEFGEEKTLAEFEHCVRELGFVGIKLHGFSHGINPLSDLGRAYFEAASSLGVPLMACVGAHGAPFTNPALYAYMGRRYRDLPIVFAHLDFATAEVAIALAEEHPNIYLSSSLSIPVYLAQALTTLGGDRVMLASEDSWSIGAEIAKFVATGTDQETLEEALCHAPCRVFGLADD